MVTAGLYEFVDCCHNFGNTRLVVCTEKRCSVGHHKLLADIFHDSGAQLRCQRHTVVQLHFAAVVHRDARTDIFAGSVGCGIHMGDKSEHGRIFKSFCGKCGYNVAAAVRVNVRKSE